MISAGPHPVSIGRIEIQTSPPVSEDRLYRGRRSVSDLEQGSRIYIIPGSDRNSHRTLSSCRRRLSPSAGKPRTIRGLGSPPRGKRGLLSLSPAPAPHGSLPP